ncbi:MAG: VCBS domain-containing protein, partial [Candidatus Izemoplasmatales bacterium]
EELISLRALDTDIYESDKKAFIDEENKKLAADANYVVQEFDPFKYYDSKYLIYSHPQGEALVPEDVVNYLVNETGFAAIDYDQNYVKVGADRKYFNISDKILLTSFYEIWFDGDDANFDGVVNEDDEEFYGQLMTDEEGKYVYSASLKRMKSKAVGQVTEVKFIVSDEDGAKIEISGLIIIT